MCAIKIRNIKSRITLLVCNGKSEEGYEGGHCQSWEEHADDDEELQAF